MKSIHDLISLENRRALVTGGAGHIGSALASTLVELGAAVAIVDRRVEQTQACATRLTKLGPGRAVPLVADFLDAQQTRSCVHQAAQVLGGLDILVHTAAFVGSDQIPGWSAPFADQTVEAWDAAIRVNLTAAFVLAQQAKDYLVESGHGSVILIGSIYGVAGTDHRLYEGTDMFSPAAYSASKGGLLQLNRYLATLLAPRVRVNTITPGGVWRNQSERFVQRYVERTPLGRMANEEDFKGAIAYLASDMSRYVTGTNLIVDGGWTTW